MRQSNRFKSIYFSIFSLILVTVSSCYEPTEGCLENWATNYSILADEPCLDDCCTSPVINAQIVYYLNDSTTYTFGDTILHEATNTYYSIESINMMVSDFEIDSSGVLVEEVNDTTTIDGVIYETDFGFSTEQGSAITLTEYQDSYRVDGLTFLQGLIPAWQDTTIFGRDNTTIALAIDSLYLASTDVFTRMSCVVVFDTVNVKTLHLVSSYPDTIRHTVSADEGIILAVGDDSTLEIRVDIDEWFDSVIQNHESTETTQLANSLASRFEDFISLQ